MEAETWSKEDITQTTAGQERSAGSSGMGNIKTIVANKLHDVADTISKKSASVGVKPEVAQYGEQASAILDQAADYVENLDYDQMKESARTYIKENPGRSLLIAGITGLVLGSILRRR